LDFVWVVMQILVENLAKAALSEVQELATELTCTDFTTWRPSFVPHCQVRC